MEKTKQPKDRKNTEYSIEIGKRVGPSLYDFEVKHRLTV